MNIALIAFTQNGSLICRNVMGVLRSENHICTGYAKGSFEMVEGVQKTSQTLAQWTEYWFNMADALIFISASGIAVRAIAPFVKSKNTDPACIVIDEQGRFVIPILSGHIGGANELAKIIAEKTDAVPVVTTATDLNGLFAVDEWARKNNMYISDMSMAKRVASDLLHKRPVEIKSIFKIEGALPKGIFMIDEIQGEPKRGTCIEISVSDSAPCENVLRLIPKNIFLGIGCRRGISREIIESQVSKVLKDMEISSEAVAVAASIDLKKDEKGLIDFCKNFGISFETFSSKQLAEVKGEFSRSEFVSSVTGVDNVCERAAVLASGHGKLLMRKRAENGVTVAVALKDTAFRF